MCSSDLTAQEGTPAGTVTGVIDGAVVRLELLPVASAFTDIAARVPLGLSRLPLGSSLVPPVAGTVPPRNLACLRVVRS